MTRAALVETFADFPARLAETARGVADRPVAAGEWGPAEIVRHLIAVEDEVWQSRFAAMAAEDEPRWDWTEPGLAPGFDDVSLDGIVAAFAAARAVTAATARVLDDAGWTRVGIHATYGRLDMAGLLRLAIDHDVDHLDAIGRT